MRALRRENKSAATSFLKLMMLRHCFKGIMFTMTSITTAAELIGHEVQITSRAQHLAAWTGLHGCAVAVAPDGRVVVDIVLGRVSCDVGALDLLSGPSRSSLPR